MLDSPLLTKDAAPVQPKSRPWWPLAWVVRAVGDLARYSYPRYASAPALRKRLARKTIRYLTEHGGRFDPVTRWLALTAARLDHRRRALGPRDPARGRARAIPSSTPIDAYVRAHEPVVVLVADAVSTHPRGSST